MAHPVIDDYELGASPFFMYSLWLTMNNVNSEARHLLRSAASVSHVCGKMWKLDMSRLMTSL